MASPMDVSVMTNPETAVVNEEGPASFFCRQCQSAYRQPKILKCLHSFCAQCLHDELEKTTDKTSLICPLCACATAVPPDGVSALTPNSFLERVSKDYVTEVKSNLASKSLNAQEERARHEHHLSPHVAKPAATTGIKTAFHHELRQHKLSNLTDEQKSESSKKDVDAVLNRHRLQAKMMGLQEEALRVTYAIDRVNHHKTEWLQRREDLKRAIQRRSAQFQMLVKKMERQLVSQIDEKGAEDKFYESLDKGKTELRKNLKQVLHEVSVIKGVWEMGSHKEINELSSSLLSPSVGVSEVALDKISYQLDLPTKTIDEMVSVGFGNLVMTTEESSVYAPELKDYANLQMDEISTEEERTHSIALNKYGIMSAISGDAGPAHTSISRRSSSTVGRQTRRRGSDFGKTDILEEFQNARESLRNRRQEILRQGQSTRDQSPWRGDSRRASRPTSRRDRGQSLDRGANVMETNRMVRVRQSSESKGDVRGGDSRQQDEREVVKIPSEESCTPPTSGGVFESVPKTHKSEDTTMPSPIIEEAVASVVASVRTHVPDSNPSNLSPSIRRKQQQQQPIPTSPNDLLNTERFTQELTQQAASRSRHLSSSSSTSPGRLSPSVSPTFAPELAGRNVESSRNLRRAITSAADKKSKIEFLRENWQKRKEILIQTRGFVSSEESSSSNTDSRTAATSTPDDSASTENASKLENAVHTQIPLASRGIGSPPLRSKFTSARQAQTQQKQYQENADSAKVVQSSASASSEKTRTTRRPFISASSFDEELKKLKEARKLSGVNVADLKMVTVDGKRTENDQTCDKTDGGESNKGGDKQKETEQNVDDDDEEEEEVMVVETETVTIPVNNEMLQDMKMTDQAEIKVSSAVTNSGGDDKKETVVSKETDVKEYYVKESDVKKEYVKESHDDEEEEEMFVEETVVVAIPNEGQAIKPVTTYTSYSPDTTRIEMSPRISSPTPTSAPKPSSSTGSVFTWSTPATSSDSSSQRKNEIIGDVPSGIKTTPSDTARTDSKNSVKQQPEEAIVAPKLRSLYGPPQTQSQSSTSSRTVTSVASAFSNITSTTPTTTTTASSSLPSSSASQSTAASSTTSTSTATSSGSTSTVASSITTSTVISSSSSSTTTTTTTSGRYSRRHIPRTETIDIAALMASFYKPPPPPSPTVSQSERDKSKAEDNKENVGGLGASTVLNRQNSSDKTPKTVEVHSNTSSTVLQSHTEPKAQSVLKHEYKEDVSSSSSPTGKIEIGSNNADPKPVGSAFQRNYYTSSVTQTSRKSYTSKETPLQDVHNSQTSSSPTTVNTSTASSVTDTIKATTDTPIITASSTLQPSRHSNSVVSSLYSKYYSNPKSSYSPKPAETVPSKPADEDNQQSPRDQKVDETFTQAESSRRRYDPAEITSSQTRRHTVEIGKTLPKGVKILDLYKSQDAESDKSDGLAEQPSSSSSNNNTIEESPAETESETTSVIGLKTQQPPRSLSSSSLGFTSTSTKLSRTEIPLKQHLLPDKVDFRFAKSETRTSPQALSLTTISGHKVLPSPTRNLSTASSPSPASSPLMEDKKFVIPGPGDDSGNSNTSSSSRNLKEIARKKRERWRRLTVY